MKNSNNRREFFAKAGLAGGTALVMPELSQAKTAYTEKEKPDKKLQKKLMSLAENFRGEVGIYARHLGDGRSVRIRADELFPTASMIKIAIMARLFDMILKGEIGYHDNLEWTGEPKYPYEGEDILSCFRTGQKIKLSKLIMLMITISDNQASFWLQQIAGYGTEINPVLESLSLEKLRMNSRTPGREEAQKNYGWGQTTPYEMCRILELIRTGRAVSRGASEEMYRILTRIYWSGEALSQIPPQVQAASKQGALSRSRSEVVLVNAPHGDYVFCCISKNQEDTGWEDTNEGYQLLRDVSRTIWRHFEPDYDWEPAVSVGMWDQNR